MERCSGMWYASCMCCRRRFCRILQHFPGAAAALQRKVLDYFWIEHRSGHYGTGFYFVRSYGPSFLERSCPNPDGTYSVPELTGAGTVPA